MVQKSRYFYQDITEYDNKAKKFLTPEIEPVLIYIKEQLQNLNQWSANRIHEIIISATEKFVLKLGKVAQPIRVAVTGGTVSPPIDVTLELLGKEKVIARLEQVLLTITG